MVNVIGLGYIGLPTALMMASHGVEVVGTDYNKELVATLNAGKTTFKEEGLDELFADALKAGIKFSTDYQVCDTYIVSVPTPYDKLDKKIDPCYVVAACKTVLEVAPEGAVLVGAIPTGSNPWLRRTRCTSIWCATALSQLVASWGGVLSSATRESAASYTSG